MGFDIKKVGAAVNQKRQFNIDNVGKEVRKKAVSYTHLTLPTILRV